MSLLSGLFAGGGPSSQEQAIAGQESTFATDLLQDYGQLFSKDMDTLNNLRGQYSALTANGPNQHGFNAPVLNALNTQLLASNAAGYRNASAVVRNFMAGQGGGATSGITSGISAQIEGDIASKSAASLQQGQVGITLQDYGVGRENYFKGVEGMSSLAGMEGSLVGKVGSMAGEELGSAFKSAQTIKKEQDAAKAAKWGAITGLATTALTMGAGGFAALGAGESFGEGAKDFLGGMFGGTGSPPPGGGGSSDASGSGE